MPIYHQGRKVKEVHHQGRKVKELWYMGRKVYSSIMYGGYGAFIEEMAQRCEVASLGDTPKTFTPSVFSSTTSQCHLVASGDATLEVTQKGRRALFIDVRGGTIYAETTSQRSSTARLNAPMPTGTHAITLTTYNQTFGYGVALLVDGKVVAVGATAGTLVNQHKIFEIGGIETTTKNAVAWGAGGAAALSSGDMTAGWIVDSLRPGHVVWYSGGKITYLAQGGEAMAWAYGGGHGGKGGGDTFSGSKGSDGNGALVPGFTLDMIPDVTIGAGGKGGSGSNTTSGRSGSPGDPTTIGNWFTTADATERPTPVAWGETYKGSIPGAGGSGGSSGSSGDSGSSGSAGESGGLVIARRW